jgi:Tfp pilus assembly protein FimT
MDRAVSRSHGFSLTELMLVVSIFIVMVSVGVPATLNVNEAMKLGNTVREFERELQSARLKAVQANRTLRVRFNCPAVGRYRRIEVLGSAADATTTRCDETAYPFPSPRDADPATPAYDGPARYLADGVQLVAGAQGVDFFPDGRAFQVSASGAVTPIGQDGLLLTLSKRSQSRTVNVNGMGRVELR